jgi:psp operon transcriptional activator
MTEPGHTPEALRVELLGRSEAFLQFNEQIAVVARVDRPVLLIGERGTGKELAAARLHYLSRRWQGPFLATNCAALTPSLLESELFGHEAGAFTGAVRRRAGRFEAADGGTLFLDELAAMPLRAQEKVLRVVEYGEFERIGSTRPLRVDTRIVGAANIDLPELARRGRFKQDLLDRLSFEVLTLPPLRERAGDILLLAERFAASMALELGHAEAPPFTPQAERLLLRHHWPGNVRELKNAVERAVYRALHLGADTMDSIELDPFDSPWRPGVEKSRQPAAATLQKDARPLEKPGAAAPPTHAPEAAQSSVFQGQSPDLPLDLPTVLRDVELRALEAALAEARHNQRKAAQLLGLSYNQFRGLYRKHKDRLGA